MSTVRLTLFGAGFSGRHIAREACNIRGLEHVALTRRSWSDTPDHAPCVPGSSTVPAERFAFAGEPIDNDHPLDAILAETTHVLSSVPPGRGETLDDPVLDVLRRRLMDDRHALCWVGYLSTIGVYGDHDGGWVDETTVPDSCQTRSRRRVEAEHAWRELAAGLGIAASVFRLSGIYGPGRNAVRDAVRGEARIIDKPGQVFNRIHVDDIAGVVCLAMRRRHDGVLNVTDDRPAPNAEVVRYAHRLVGRAPPEPVPFEQADLSPMARSFYAENKRVSNRRSRETLGYDYRWPDYERGLGGLWREDRWQSAW